MAIDDPVLQCDCDRCDGSVQYVSPGGDQGAYFRHVVGGRREGCTYPPSKESGSAGRGASRKTAERHRAHVRSILVDALRQSGLPVPGSQRLISYPTVHGPFYGNVVTQAAARLRQWDGRTDWPIIKASAKVRREIESRLIRLIGFVSQVHMKAEMDALVLCGWIHLLHRNETRRDLLCGPRADFYAHHAITVRPISWEAEPDLEWRAASIIAFRAKELLIQRFEAGCLSPDDVAIPRHRWRHLRGGRLKRPTL